MFPERDEVHRRPAKQTLPAKHPSTAEVGIGPNDNGGFALDIDLRVSLPGLAADAAKELVDAAHQVCPYSNAEMTRNNVAVRLASRVSRRLQRIA